MSVKDIYLQVKLPWCWCRDTKMHPVFCFISYVFIVYMLKEKETGPWGDLRKKKISGWGINEEGDGGVTIDLP
jgi:hypothetical protein